MTEHRLQIFNTDGVANGFYLKSSLISLVFNINDLKPTLFYLPGDAKKMLLELDHRKFPESKGYEHKHFHSFILSYLYSLNRFINIYVFNLTCLKDWNNYQDKRNYYPNLIYNIVQN